MKIQGFRDSSQAPIGIKSRESSSAFEKSAKFAGEILAAWVEINPDLAQNVFQMLTDRGWIILPADADRSKLPGFLIKWPAKDSFEILTTEFREKHIDIEYTDDDVSLMIVWLSNRLPYEMVTEDILIKNNNLKELLFFKLDFVIRRKFVVLLVSKFDIPKK